MSPASSTGEDTARASPMLTMSFSARLISAGLPAPSMTMTSFSSASESNASKICGMSAFFRAK